MTIKHLSKLVSLSLAVIIIGFAIAVNGSLIYLHHTLESVEFFGQQKDKIFTQVNQPLLNYLHTGEATILGDVERSLNQIKSDIEGQANLSASFQSPFTRLIDESQHTTLIELTAADKLADLQVLLINNEEQLSQHLKKLLAYVKEAQHAAQPKKLRYLTLVGDAQLALINLATTRQRYFSSRKPMSLDNIKRPLQALIVLADELKKLPLLAVMKQASATKDVLGFSAKTETNRLKDNAIEPISEIQSLLKRYSMDSETALKVTQDKIKAQAKVDQQISDFQQRLLKLGAGLTNEYQRHEHLIIFNMLGCSLLIISAMVFCIFGGARILRRVSNLNSIMSKIAYTNDLSLRAEVVHNDEIDDMARSFNSMVQQLQETSKRINQKANDLLVAAQYARSLIETNLDPLVMINSEGKITDVNLATEQVTGMPRDKLIGSDFAGYFTDPETARNLLVFSQGFVTDYKLAIRHVSGKITEVLYNASVYQDHNGNVLGILAAARDITERKKLDNELRLAATIFESKLGMMVTDANKIILRINQAFTDITGYSQEEVIGKVVAGLLKSDRHNRDFYATMLEQLDNTGHWAGEIWHVRKNGEHYPDYLTIAAVYDQAGQLINYASTFEDITLRKTVADQFEHLAFYDPLTNLPNRRLLQDRLKPALASSDRSGRKGALLLIDLDNFKTLNDTLGHDMGDLLLQQVANRLESTVRENDTVARLGGDEFVVMLVDLNSDALKAATQTKTVGSKILAALNQPYLLDTHVYHSSPSIGATLFNGRDHSLAELMKQADIAMYHAKNSGRNALRFFDAQMQTSINSSAAMEADLRLALTEQQFELYYQPQVNHNQQIIGAEALIRWRHPQRGMISPAEFIPLAEETGLIVPIGQWVLETAAAQLKAWEISIHTLPLRLAINVSAKQFHLPDFVDHVSQVLCRNEINPDKLKLELTETMVLDDVEDTLIKMKVLKNIGVRFSMDDFGTGHSSLSILKKLPFDQLKIDQSFVCDLSIDQDDAVIVKTIIQMATNLGMEVIAEGVETQAQHDILKLNNCFNYQGYLFSKPVPIDQFDVLLKQSLAPSHRLNLDPKNSS